MRYRITTPEPGWNGKVGTVVFANGVAECDADPDAAPLHYFRGQGYGVEELDDADQARPSDTARIAELEAELAALRAAAAAPAAPSAPSAPDAPRPPAQADNKDAWVAYAITQGVAEDDAKAMTKPELVDRFGKKAGDQS